LHSWSISYGGWDFIPNLGSTVAEGTPTKSQLLQLEHWTAADWTSAGLAWAHKETEVNIDKQKWYQIFIVTSVILPFCCGLLILLLHVVSMLHMLWRVCSRSSCSFSLLIDRHVLTMCRAGTV